MISFSSLNKVKFVVEIFNGLYKQNENPLKTYLLINLAADNQKRKSDVDLRLPFDSVFLFLLR